MGRDECYGEKKQGEEIGNRRTGLFAESNRVFRGGLTEKVSKGLKRVRIVVMGMVIWRKSGPGNGSS